MKNRNLSTTSTSRFFWADSIRVIAIYFVIFLHTGSLLTSVSSKIFSVSAAYNLARTSVPLFIILSGALLLTKDESYKDFFKKRYSRILFPWIFWTIIYFFWYAYSKHQSISISSARSIYQLFFSGFWFLPLIASIYFFTPLLRIFVRHAKTRDLLFGVALWFVFASIFPFFQLIIGSGLPYNNSAVQYIGYFILGYAFVKVKLSKRILHRTIAVFVLSLIISFISIFLPNGAILNEYPYLFLSPFAVFNSVAFFALLYAVCVLFEKKIPQRAEKIMASMSRATLGIYLIHFIILEISYPAVSLFADSFVPIPLLAVFIKTAVIFLASFCIIYLLQKVPVLKKIVA